MKKYLNMAATYLGLGLVSGVFFREFTKLSGFEGKTVLSVMHTHILVLGFLFAMMLVILEKNFNLSQLKGEKAWFITYNVSFVYMIGAFLARGILQVNGTTMSGLNHIAGLGHALMGVSLIWFMVRCYKVIGKEA